MENLPKYIDYIEFENNVLQNNPNSNITLIKKAFNYAKEKHGSQTRKSGHPYYTHPLSVANIVSNLKLDDISIVSALLHDVVEDTEVSVDEIEEIFGLEVAKIVDGVTKLGAIKYKTEEIQQAENLRKLFFALSQDIRVLIVKLCDRLHNMMTMEHILSYKKRRFKAIETLEIYAPLAQRIGMYKIKDILQDLSFAIINSRARNFVLKRIENIKNKSEQENAQHRLEFIKEKLKSYNIWVNVDFRIKTAYSIWKKMQNKTASFDKIYDIIGYRIIVDNEINCYTALSVIHQIYKFIPNSFMDYISNPKSNGYKSIHTFVIDENGTILEFQIRTKQMHQEAEFGLAAHWGYKNGESLNSEDFKQKWITKILEILNSKSSAREVLEYTKLEMYQDKVFVFTPSGGVIHLSNGAKILDFAFAVSDNLGKYFHAAKINNNITQNLDTVINNGDKIEIITAKNQTLSKEWIKYVTTGVAKYAIKKFSHEINYEQNGARGLEMIKKACILKGINFNQDLLHLMMKYSCEKDAIQMYLQIFNGKIDPMKLINKIFPNKNKDIKRSMIISYHNLIKPVFIEEIPNLRCFLSKCCIFENKGISKILITSSGAFIHNCNCKYIENIPYENIINVNTTIKNNNEFIAYIVIEGEGLLNFFISKVSMYNIKLCKYSKIYNENKYEKFTIKALNVTDINLFYLAIKDVYPEISASLNFSNDKI